MADYAMQILAARTIICKALHIRPAARKSQPIDTNSALHMLLTSDEAMGCCFPGIEQAHIIVSYVMAQLQQTHKRLLNHQRLRVAGHDIV
jgi:hypothetical protein